mgnify:CR=1 FL=1
MKKRLDVLLVERGLQESRQKAQATIMSGLVFVKGQRADKPGTAVANEAELEVRGHTLRYVSRGGLKLEKALHTALSAIPASKSFTELLRPPKLEINNTSSEIAKAPVKAAKPIKFSPMNAPIPKRMAAVAPKEAPEEIPKI